ncbi:Protein of unknown function [Pyronema omphalodes CBS 100304]|uniref:Uncharacterized protein n=1 Tax=Pyronema omphalodes (strain CBS 100304) TaxID=1076935 RepID=U4LIE1_PYROM|nr:Protein of unknown function [Pyronema omphalodes CBS 100304]
MSLDLLRKRPIDGPSDFKLRYYIKFTPETGKWVLSYSAQPEDFDCDKASAVTGMKCDFTMRYCKPPLAGVNNFFWPQGQTWSPVGLYKCQPDGTLEMVRRGDSMVMGRMFFSIGRPTIRIICMPKATDLSVVYKLHCVDPEWIKRVEQHLAKAAGQKPMFGGFLNLLNVGNKRAELPIVSVNTYIRQRAERVRDAIPLFGDQRGKMEQQLFRGRPDAQILKQEMEKKQSIRSPSRRRPSHDPTQHIHKPSPLIRSTTAEDLSPPGGTTSQEGPQQPHRMPPHRQSTLRFAQEENRRPHSASIADFIIPKTPAPIGVFPDSGDELMPPNPPFAREGARRKSKSIGQIGVGNGTSKDGVTGTLGVGNGTSKDGVTGTLGVVSRPTSGSFSSSFKAKATTSVTKTSVSNTAPRLERAQTAPAANQPRRQPPRVVSALEAKLESGSMHYPIMHDNVVGSGEIVTSEVYPLDVPQDAPMIQSSLAPELNPETASMPRDIRSSKINYGSMVNLSSVEAHYGSMASSFPEDERQRILSAELLAEDANGNSDTTLYVGSYRGPSDSTCIQSPGYMSYRTPIRVAPTGEDIQLGFRGPAQSSYFSPRPQTTIAPRDENFQQGYQQGFDIYQQPHSGQPEYYFNQQIMSPKSPPDPDLIAQIEAQILAGYYNQDAASPEEIQAAEEEQSYRERIGGVKN